MKTYLTLLIFLIFAVSFTVLNAQEPFYDKKAKRYGYKMGDSIALAANLTEAGRFYEGWAYIEKRDSFGFVDSAWNVEIRREYAPIEVAELPKKLRYAYKGAKPDEGYWFGKFSRYSEWGMNSRTVLGYLLESMRRIPLIYSDYPNQLPKVCAGEGLLLARHNMLISKTPDVNQWLRKVMLEIAGDEVLRNLAVELLRGYLVELFGEMPTYHRLQYRKIADHALNYLDSYDEPAVRKHLKENEREFAYVDHLGRRDDYRKLTSFIDRLIVYHQVITAEELLEVIETLAGEL